MVCSRHLRLNFVSTVLKLTVSFRNRCNNFFYFALLCFLQFGLFRAVQICTPARLSTCPHVSLSLSGLPLLCFRSVTLIALPFNGESLHGNTHVQHTITTHTHSTHNSPNTHALRYLYYQAQKIPLICVEMFRVLIIFRRNTITVQFTIFFFAP